MISFKEYIEQSKKQLHEALNKIPTVESKYRVDKYCSLETVDGSILPLRPKQMIYVKWVFKNMNNPIPESVTVENTKKNISQVIQISWESRKFRSWLVRYTTEL